MRVTGEESLETAVSICAEWNYARIWSGVWRKAKRKGDQRAEPMDAVSEQKHVYDSAGSRCLCSYLGLKQFKKKPLMSVHFKKKSISSPPEALDHRFSHHAFFLNPEHFELTLCMLGLCPCFNNLFNLKKKKQKQNTWMLCKACSQTFCKPCSSLKQTAEILHPDVSAATKFLVPSGIFYISLV